MGHFPWLCLITRYNQLICKWLDLQPAICPNLSLSSNIEAKEPVKVLVTVLNVKPQHFSSVWLDGKNMGKSPLI
jgi:hypothetical protein